MQRNERKALKDQLARDFDEHDRLMRELEAVNERIEKNTRRLMAESDDAGDHVPRGMGTPNGKAPRGHC